MNNSNNTTTTTTTIADLFKTASKITRGGKAEMLDGFKVYHDKIAIKHPTLEAGDKVLAKITNNSIIFIKSENGNRTLSGKGSDGRVMLALNQEMRKVFKTCFEQYKTGGKCKTLALKLEQVENTTYYVLENTAAVVEEETA